MTSYFIEIAFLVLIPASYLQLFFFEGKKNVRSLGVVFISEILATGLAFALAVPFHFLYPSEKGIAGLVLGFVAATIIWCVVSRKLLKFSFVGVATSALIPLSFFIAYLSISFFVYHLGDPQRQKIEAARQAVGTIDDDFKAIALSIEDFQRQCGRIPIKLSELVEDPGNCRKWEKSVYAQFVGNLMSDPWKRPYLYLKETKTSYEVKTLGADGVSGGEGLNSDRSFRKDVFSETPGLPARNSR